VQGGGNKSQLESSVDSSELFDSDEEEDEDDSKEEHLNEAFTVLSNEGESSPAKLTTSKRKGSEKEYDEPLRKRLR